MFSKNDTPPTRRNTLLTITPSTLNFPAGSEDSTHFKRFSSAEDIRIATVSKDSDSIQESEQDNHSHYFRRYEVLIEFANLRNPKISPSGVYIMPATDNLYIWYGVIFIHKGYYTDAVLKFRINIPNSYPTSAPQVTFITDTFHPLVDQNGRFAVNAQFPNWTAHRDHIVDVLRFIKKSFKVAVLDTLTEEVCLNKQAYRMYHDEPHLFIRLSEQCAKVSTADSVVYDDFPLGNPIKFKPLSDSKFEELYSNIVGPAVAAAANKNGKPNNSLDGVLDSIRKKVSNNLTRLFE